MKYIVGGRAAGETLLRRDKKSGYAGQDQYRREDSQGDVVDTLLNDALRLMMRPAFCI